MHAISSYRGNRPTNTQTRTQTNTITIHCAAKLSAQCNYGAEADILGVHRNVAFKFADLLNRRLLLKFRYLL